MPQRSINVAELLGGGARVRRERCHVDVEMHGGVMGGGVVPTWRLRGTVHNNNTR